MSHRSESFSSGTVYQHLMLLEIPFACWKPRILFLKRRPTAVKVNTLNFKTHSEWKERQDTKRFIQMRIEATSRDSPLHVKYSGICKS